MTTIEIKNIISAFLIVIGFFLCQSVLGESFEIQETIIPQEYQTHYGFDEFTMKGVNNRKCCLVYVKETKDSIIVVPSFATDSCFMYKRINDCWYNHVVLEWNKRSQSVYKDGFDMPARIYDRLILNDTIIELRTSFIKDSIFLDLYVKTRDKVYCYYYEENDFKYNQNDVLDKLFEMRSLISQGVINNLYEQGLVYSNYCSSTYSIFISNSGNSVLIKRINNKTNTGIQIGLENYYDIDNYSINCSEN